MASVDFNKRPNIDDYARYLGRDGERMRRSSTLVDMPPENLQETVQAQIDQIKDLSAQEKKMFEDLTRVEMVDLFTIFRFEKIRSAQVVRDPESKDVFLCDPEPIASGGYGNVYKGFSGKFRRSVAMKSLLKDSKENEQMLQREVWAHAKEDHPNVVKIYGYSTKVESPSSDFHGKPLMVMEYLSPERSERLDSFKDVKPEEAVSLCDQLCNAIESMYKPEKSRLKRMMTPWGSSQYKGARLLHLDIKPNNIFVTNDGVVKLTDFGISSSVRDLSQPSETVIGSADWMSPERFRGEELDISTELFSLTTVLYYVLTGKSFFATYNSFDTYDMLLTAKKILKVDFVMTPELIAYCEKHGLNKDAVEKFFSIAWAKKKEKRFTNIDQYRKAFALAMIRVKPARA